MSDEHCGVWAGTEHFPSWGTESKQGLSLMDTGDTELGEVVNE